MTGTTHAGEARRYGLKSNIQTLFGDKRIEISKQPTTAPVIA